VAEGRVRGVNLAKNKTQITVHASVAPLIRRFAPPSPGGRRSLRSGLAGPILRSSVAETALPSTFQSVGVDFEWKKAFQWA
jgi:hypothetical protein